MDKNEILKLLDREEGNRLEFKERFTDSVLKTIVAFANTYGGLIIESACKSWGLMRGRLRQLCM